MFISKVSGTILILYSLLYSKSICFKFIYLALSSNFSFKVQNRFNLSSFGFHNLQVTLYSLFKSSIIFVSNIDFSSISEILNIFALSSKSVVKDIVLCSPTILL